MRDSVAASYDDEAALAPRDPAAAIKRLLALSVLAAVALVAWHVLAVVG